MHRKDWKRSLSSRAAPAHASGDVEIAEYVLARHEIFRAIDACADDVADAQGDIGCVRRLLEQPQLHAEAAVVVVGAKQAVEVAVAKRAFKPRQGLEAEAVALRVL